MKAGLKYYLYTTARSNAMNGITSDTETVYVKTWWAEYNSGCGNRTGHTDNCIWNFICFTIMEKEKGAGVIMREHLANHTFGFYLSISAGILSVVSLLFYLGADNQGAAVLPLIVCSILAEVAGIAINRFTGKAGVLMLIPTVNALLFSAAIILSIIPQVDSLGYLVSGLYSFEDMKAFILYAVFAILTWLGYLAASFMDMQK